MIAIKGTYKNEEIVLDQPADWPEGSRIVVEPVPEADTLGIQEAAWMDTPEAIAEWLRWYDALEPLMMTAEEDAEWRAALKAQKDYDIRIEGLFP